MAMVQGYYTLDDFQQIMFEGNCALSADILSVIKYLEENVVVPVEVPESVAVPQIRKTDIFSSNGRNNRTDRSTDKRRSNNNVYDKRTNNSSWSDVRGKDRNYRNNSTGNNSSDTSSITFKATKIVTKEGVEKQLNDIRVLLNKLSAKNYNTQKDTVINQIIEILGDEPDRDSDSDNETENNNIQSTRIRIATAIFDIASSNKFLSELYANLYAELVVQSSIFSEILVDIITKYKATLYEIHYIDANVDYDGFCNYNKTNDMRKAMATFIVNLMVRGLIGPDLVLNTIVEFQDLTFSYIDIDNKTNEVDEITENVVLLLTMCKPTLSEHPIWIAKIGPNIEKMVGMKAKEHKSLSSRVFFKYM